MNTLFREPEIFATEHAIYSFIERWAKPVYTEMYAEFNKKKQAWGSQNKTYSQTGEIDIDLLPYFRTSENIFKNQVKFRNGKSHGIYLSIDASLSMSHRYFSCAAQAWAIYKFCRMAGVHFRFSLFGSNELDEHDSIISNNSNKSGGPGVLPQARPAIIYKKCIRVVASSEWSDKKNINSLRAMQFMAALYAFNAGSKSNPTKGSHLKKDVQLIMEKMEKTYPSFFDFDSYYRPGGRSTDPSMVKYRKIYEHYSLTGYTDLVNSLYYANIAVPKWKSDVGVEEVTYISITDGEDTNNCRMHFEIQDSNGMLITLNKEIESARGFDAGFLKENHRPGKLPVALYVKALRLKGIKAVCIHLEKEISNKSTWIDCFFWQHAYSKSTIKSIMREATGYVRLENISNYNEFFVTTMNNSCSLFDLNWDVYVDDTNYKSSKKRIQVMMKAEKAKSDSGKILAKVVGEVVGQAYSVNYRSVA